MLTLVQPDGIIHHSLNHTSTVTGRFSSSNPNLQNLPKGGKSNVKALFKSRFLGGSIIQSDFTALEVYVQANLTNCKQLIEDLKAGLDMHCVRVSQTYGLDYDWVRQKAVVEKDPEWDAKRTKAKVFSFQRAYGAGAALIAESTGMALEEVNALIEAENARYPEIEAFYGRLTDALNASSESTGRVVQHPDFPGLTCDLRRGSYRTPDNKLYTWRMHPAPDFAVKQGTFANFSPTEVKNYPVQGMGGEWAKAAMWLAVRTFYASRNFGGRALLVNQVHDALYVDADKAVLTDAASLLHACMLEASTFMEWYFGWTIPVPVPSETMAGPNMLEEARIPLDAADHWRNVVRVDFIGEHRPSWEQPLQLAA
jgi:DNA polymerase I-like protein with 3'-5' exonuclease and polymerase domains